MNELIIKGNVKTIDSREVAEMMEIKHYKVLEKLEGTKDGKTKGIIPILTNHEIVVSEYFIESTYKDGSGKENRCYECTKLGCDFLANKFTGEKGILFTAKYIKAFDQMEKIIQTKHDNQIALTNEVNNKIDKTLNDLSEYYRPTHVKKLDLNRYIRNVLGVNYTRKNSDRVKEISLTMLGNYKTWESVPKDILNSADTYKIILDVGTKLNTQEGVIQESMDI